MRGALVSEFVIRGSWEETVYRLERQGQDDIFQCTVIASRRTGEILLRLVAQMSTISVTNDKVTGSHC